MATRLRRGSPTSPKTSEPWGPGVQKLDLAYAAIEFSYNLSHVGRGVNESPIGQPCLVIQARPLVCPLLGCPGLALAVAAGRPASRARQLQGADADPASRTGPQSP
jgi:hypothetical protein